MAFQFFRVFNSATYLVFGLVMLIHIVRNWNNPNKERVRYSEVLYSVLFIVNSILVYFLFSFENITESGLTLLYGIMFASIFGILFFVFIMNVFPTMIKVKRHPELLENDPIMTRNYDEFLKMFEEGSQDELKTKDIKKDFSRKLLHIIQLTGITVIHYAVFAAEESLAEMGVTPLAFRNSIYVFIGSLFIFMFTSADLIRITNFHYLPDWARKWYYISLEPKSEAYSINSAVPFLLTIFLFMFSPINIIVGTSIVSCLADGVASVVGKAFGKHKFNNFGKFPNKSFEGLFAGMITAFVGVFLVFAVFIPSPDISIGLAAVFALVAALVFFVVDAFSVKIADNILNTFLPGFAFHLILWII